MHTDLHEKRACDFDDLNVILMFKKVFIPDTFLMFKIFLIRLADADIFNVRKRYILEFWNTFLQFKKGVPVFWYTLLIFKKGIRVLSKKITFIY